MVSRGKFVIHSRAVPPLTAGDYVLQGTQTIDAGGNRLRAPLIETQPLEAWAAHVPGARCG